jgi:membrane protein implicated in regulation of membrane protease activity
MTFKNMNESHCSYGVGRLVILLCVLGLVTLFALGQAFTFAWLATSQVNVARLEYLQWRFWGYTILAMILAVFDIVIIWQIWRGTRRRKDRFNNPAKP